MNSKTISFFLILIFVISACSNQSTLPPSLKHIRVGVLPVADCLQVFVAQDQGFFKDEGLDVELVTMAGGSLVASAIEANELEVGWSNTISIALANTQGFNYSFFAPGAVEAENNRPHKLMVSVDSKIKNVKDLEGKIIAVNTYANVPYVAVIKLVRNEGIDPNTIKFVEVPFPDMPSLLASSKIDAALMIEPFVTSSIANNRAKVLVNAPLASLGDRILVAAWFSKYQWLEKHPMEANSFLKAILKANNYIYNNDSNSRSILLKYTKLDERLSKDIILPEYSSKLDEAEMHPVFSAAHQIGLLKTDNIPSIIYGGFPNK